MCKNSCKLNVLNNNIENIEGLLIKILFRENLSRKDFENINFEKFVKFSSKHLLLPTIYYNLKEKKLLNFLPKDLVSFLKKIYNLNLERNKILIVEVNHLGDFLKKNKLDFLFIKGAYLIKNKLLNDIGERMIGDIDFLVDESELKKSEVLLNKLNYRNSMDFKIWKMRHSSRFLNKKMVFAVEPHSQILIYRKRKFLEGKSVLKEFENKKFEYLIKILLLNFQINDHGHLFASFSYKTAYDLKILVKSIESHKFFMTNKYIKRFILISNFLKITKIKIDINFYDKVYLERFKMKRKYLLIFKIDQLICNIIKFFPRRIIQSVEFLFNNNYRKYILKKLNITL